MDAPRASPCDGCDARCCRHYCVPLTGDDAWRIECGLDRPMWSFATLVPQVERSGAGFLLEREGPTHDLVLGTAADARKGCVFLDPGGRCSIYRLRPRACRRFPASVIDGRVRARDGVVCGPGVWENRTMARRAWRAQLEREAREIALHEAVVQGWNARVARGRDRPGRWTVLDFLDHLADAYRWLGQVRAGLRPRERSGDAFVARVRETLGRLPAV